MIFHLATNRVVVCKDTRNDVWFLPKGRRDASEETGVTAIREGFEEVCFMPSSTSNLSYHYADEV